jgi:ABC-type uncharacterized transport system substrate-binding protein
VRRREFIAVLGAVVASWPLVARAQPSGRKDPPVVGFLVSGTEQAQQPLVEAFRSGLRALGYVEGQNIRILYRFAEGRTERVSDLTTELVSRGVKIIVTAGTTAIRAAHSAAPTTPIVSWGSGDPVAMGWAQSLARPGGMITGVSIMGSALLVKRLDLLRQVRPQATVFAFLLNASNPGNPLFISEVKDAADQMGVKVHVFEVKEIGELVGAFRRMTSLGAHGLLIIEDPLFSSNSPTISELALEHQIPTLSGNRDLPAAGGLLAYGFNYIALVKRSASYVDRILKGEAPGDLPIEQPTEFKLIINLKTAKALGLTVPQSLLTTADEVIE